MWHWEQEENLQAFSSFRKQLGPSVGTEALLCWSLKGQF